VRLDLSEQQRILQDTFAKLFATESTLQRVRAASDRGFDPALWRQLAAIEAPLIRVPESAHGGGLSLFDAILVAEQVGKYLASVPLIESLCANRLLAMLERPPALEWLAKVRGGGTLVTLALHEVVEAESQMVPAGAVADAVLFLRGNEVALRVLQTPAPRVSVMGGLAIAELTFNASRDTGQPVVLAAGRSVRRLFKQVCEEWKLLTAAMLAALSRQALENAAAYSRERHAFDRPIGSYQGLAHPLADSITDVEGAQLLTWYAAWSVAHQGSREAAARLSMAYWWATQVTRTAVVRAMRVFGGYGMSMEYDAQLYFCRGRACALLGGDPRRELLQVAQRLWDEGAESPIPPPEDIHIDFAHGAAAEQFAAEARRFFEAHFTPELRQLTYSSDDGYDAPFHRLLASAGFMYADWPAAVGGAGRSAYEMSALHRVYGEYGWWVTVPNTNDMVAKILMRFGSPESQCEILPRILRAQANCSLGYSEPSCGSDIFAVKTPKDVHLTGPLGAVRADVDAHGCGGCEARGADAFHSSPGKPTRLPMQRSEDARRGAHQRDFLQ
jgi:alkylation response protein AidB-like acyl-CoA dehydrogenase